MPAHRTAASSRVGRAPRGTEACAESPAAEGPGAESTGAGGGRLPTEGLRFLLARRRVLLALAGWSLAEAGQTFLTGYALARALDDGFLNGRQSVGLAWLGVAAVAVVAGAFGTRRVFPAVAALVEPLRDGLVRRVVARGLRDAVARPRHTDAAVVSRLTHQVELARDTFAGLVMVSRSFVFTAAGALIGLFSLAPVLLVVVVPPLAAGLAIFAVTLRPAARRQEAFLAADEAISEELGTVATGLRDITACGAEERMAEEAAVLLDREFRAACALARWGVLRAVALGIGAELPVVLLLVAAPWLLGRGVTAGAVVGALAYLTQSLRPAMQSLMHGLAASGARLAVVLRRLTMDAVTRGGDGQAVASPPARHAEWLDPALAAVPAGHAVEFRGVTFGYGESAQPVVQDLDLIVPQGCHLVVAGPSGIGKSTLAGLAAGLLAPRAGQVLAGGKPVHGRDAAELSRTRVLLPQEAYVFSGTVRDNLGYLRTGRVPDPEADAAVAALGMGALVVRLGGLDAAIAPAALSAGERQLIALARAYLSRAPLVLLDEATCHLDPAAEARAERAFARRPGTLIVVAHRISSARRAQRVLLMDGVRVLCGSHEELLERSSLYRDLTGHWDGPEYADGAGDGDGAGDVDGERAAAGVSSPAGD